ncbi:phage tail assembly protein T [Aliarcobacter lanthieri]|uniref:phage tail assembly protein T n=1 Tax=Aliarcobacter lanthieri TaxID=1355374 RepID=UPI003AAD1D62
MSVQELHRWYKYYEEEPFLVDRLEMQLATSNLILATSNGGNKFEFNDFMIRKTETQSKNKVDINNAESMKAMFMAIGKVKNNGKIK